MTGLVCSFDALVLLMVALALCACSDNTDKAPEPNIIDNNDNNNDGPDAGDEDDADDNDGDDADDGDGDTAEVEAGEVGEVLSVGGRVVALDARDEAQTRSDVAAGRCRWVRWRRASRP